MSLTKFSRAFWETAVAYKGSPPTVLRDYDILKDHERGMSYSQLAIRYKINRATAINICNRYKK